MSDRSSKQSKPKASTFATTPIGLRELLDASPDAIFCVDIEGRCNWLSPAIESLTGRKPGDLIGHYCTEMVAPPSRARFLRVFLRQRSRKDGTTAEHRLWVLREDGGQTAVAVRVRLIERIDGDLAFVGVLRESSAASEGAAVLETSRTRHAPDQLDSSGRLEGFERHIDDSHANERRQQDAGDASAELEARIAELETALNDARMQTVLVESRVE